MEPLETTLKEINHVLGVTGSLICLGDGTVSAQALPAQFDASHADMMARLASQTFQALDSFGQRITEADLMYGQGRLILKNLPHGILVILCARNINIPLLNLSTTNAIKKITVELEPARIAATPPPVAPSPVQPTPVAPATPAPVMLAPVTEQPDGIAPNPLLGELLAEAQRLAEASRTNQITLIAMDPVAPWIRCAETRRMLTQPQKRNMDFLCASSQANQLGTFFEQMGYQPNQRFNSMHGSERLHFGNPLRALSINIFLDVFEMYHRLDMKPLLAQKGSTISETMLTLIRLQNVEATMGDLGDLAALFIEHDLSRTPEKDKIDSSLITQLCTEDWGWYKTVTKNLDLLIAYAEQKLVQIHRDRVIDQARRLRSGIQVTPKSLRWQTRASLGETIRWYATPIRADTFVGRPDMSLY
ncbi:MAG: hypothetical protein HY868_19385 [Chloroflexi bacterium]|nr:hypothetical protein [Chloroflexota bacterium]